MGGENKAGDGKWEECGRHGFHFCSRLQEAIPGEGTFGPREEHSLGLETGHVELLLTHSFALYPLPSGRRRKGEQRAPLPRGDSKWAG